MTINGVSPDINEQAKAFVHGLNARPNIPLSLEVSRTAGEKKLNQQRGEGWKHMLPGSVYIAVIGAKWDPGCWEKVVNMMVYNNNHGYLTWMSEQPESENDFPNADVLGMRASGMFKGLDSGAESIFFVDNDVEVPEDLLCRLGSHQLPFVVPLIRDNRDGKTMGGPAYSANQGLKPMKWACMSAMLVRSSVFNCPDVRFPNAGMEGLFFQNLWHYGHQPYMDTDVEVRTTRGPTRPGTLSWDERWERSKDAYINRTAVPDRGSLDPNNPNVVDGMYLPPGILKLEQ